MSNYAPNPNKEKVYDNLQNKTLGNVSAADIQTLTDPTFIQATNQDALITYNTINKAAMRDGSPMPLTGAIATYVQTNDADYQYFQPPQGEVWQIMSISAVNSPNVTGSNGYFFYFTNQNGQSLANSSYYSSSSSSANNVAYESLDDNVSRPVIMDHNCFLLAYSNFDNVGTSATVTWKVAYFRLR